MERKTDKLLGSPYLEAFSIYPQVLVLDAQDLFFHVTASLSIYLFELAIMKFHDFWKYAVIFCYPLWKGRYVCLENNSFLIDSIYSETQKIIVYFAPLPLSIVWTHKLQVGGNSPHPTPMGGDSRGAGVGRGARKWRVIRSRQTNWSIMHLEGAYYSYRTWYKYYWRRYN